MRGFADAPLRVLVVDDNVDTALGLECLFQLWGHEVRLAHDGPAAVDAALAFRPDAILLDVGLPHLDGFEVTRRLRALPDFRETWIVGASGYGGEADRRQARDAGMDLYLVKPFDPWRLQKMVAGRRPVPEAVPA